MASKRDYRAAYARRDARARAAGFDSYYDQRVRGGQTATPGSAKPHGQQLARARGHAARADLLRALKPGDLVFSEFDRRDEKGKFTALQLRLVDLRGREREYLLSGRQLKCRQMRELVERIEEAGATIAPGGYDLRRLTDEICAAEEAES